MRHWNTFLVSWTVLMQRANFFSYLMKWANLYPQYDISALCHKFVIMYMSWAFIDLPSFYSCKSFKFTAVFIIKISCWLLQTK